MTERHVLAENGTPEAPPRLECQRDDKLFELLLAGARVESAAAGSGLSTRTAFRRLADPSFQRRLADGRAAIRESIIMRLSDAAGDAISCLWQLLSDESASIRLQASKALIDALVRVRSSEPAGHSETIRYSIESTRSD